MSEERAGLPIRHGRSLKVSRLVVGVSAGFLLLFVLVLSGSMDFLAADGKIEKTALAALAVYWAVITLVLLAATNLQRRWKEYVLLFGTMALTLVAAELLVRHFLPYRAMIRYRGMIASRNYHHVLPPSRIMFRGYYEGKPTLIRTNEDGFRTTYSRADFLGYGHRIVVMGDSFAFGLGVTQESSCPQMMESLLRDRLGSERIAVLNAGLNSYSPFLSDLTFKGLITDYRPTVVALLLDAGDIGDDAKYLLEARFDGESVHFDDMDVYRAEYHYYGALYEIFRPVTEALATCLRYPFARVNRPRYDFDKFEITIENTKETNKYFIYRHPLELTRPYFLQTVTYLDDIADECRKIGARFLLVVTPRFHHWNPSECPDNLETAAYSRSEPYQYEYFKFFEELGGHTSYDILDMLPAFQATDEYPLVFANDPHWNERGHAFVARTLSDYLIENGFLR